MCAYQRLIQPPPPMRRLIQPPPTRPLIHPPARLTQPPPLIQPPPRMTPRRFIQPADAFGDDEIQTAPATAAIAAAPDHFPRLRKNNRRFNKSSFSDCTFASFDASSFITLDQLVFFSCSPVKVEKCMAAIRHSFDFLATVREILRGNVNSLPSFFAVTFPDAISQPMSAPTPPILN
jgi:hypothetical protein